MSALLTMARTQGEYLLIIGLFASNRMDRDIHRDEWILLINSHLAAYRALPRSVDSYD